MTTKGVPKCQIYSGLGYIFVHSPFSALHTLPVLSSLSFPTSPLSHFTSCLSFSNEVNKKLNCHGQNALCVVKTHERNTDSEHNILYLSVHQSRLTGRTHNVLDLSLRPSVCLFVCLLPSCERYTSKMNEPISMQIGQNLPPGKGMNGRPRGSGGQTSRPQEAEVLFGSLQADTSFSFP